MSKRRIPADRILTAAEFVLIDVEDGEEHDRYLGDVNGDLGVQAAAEDAIRDAAMRAGATRYDLDDVARALVEQGLGTTFRGEHGVWKVTVDVIDTEPLAHA